MEGIQIAMNKGLKFLGAAAILAIVREDASVVSLLWSAGVRITDVPSNLAHHKH